MVMRKVSATVTTTAKAPHKRTTQEKADTLLDSSSAYAVVVLLTNKVQLW